MENLTEKRLKELFGIEFKRYPKKIQNGLEDVELNHNRSWIVDLYEKNKNNLDTVALFYRGTKITYRELFKQVEVFASALSQKGVKKGSEVPMCMSPCPEFIYTIMAVNLLGAKINCFGAFDKDYVTEIINGCDMNFIICTDDQYENIRESINNSKVNEIVMYSLTDSLINGQDPYIEIDEQFYDFINKVDIYRSEQQNLKVSSKLDLLNLANSNPKKITEYDRGNIDDEFLITYSSGSTNHKRPKAIVHRNRSLVTIGRFQDPDLSGLPEMKGLVGEMIIPTHSNTSIISSMSDVLYKGCTVALEPIYNPDFLIYSLAINKPNYISISRNMIVNLCKQIYGNEKFKNFKMPYMMMLTSVGEPTSIGEEKFINKMMRKAKCGTGKLPFPLSPVPLSIGGGDCERGGMFFTPYRSLQDLNPKYKLNKGRCGLKVYGMVQLAVLDQQGNELPKGKIGRLVAKTPTTMKAYKDNEKATANFYIRDAKGELWTDCNVYAVIEKYGTLEVLERVGKEIILEDGSKLPLFYIGKEIERDTKHILSYEVVNVDNEIVIHLEFQPGRKNNIEKILIGIKERIFKKYGIEAVDKIKGFRIHSFEEGFPYNASGKRSYQALLEEGVSEKCFDVTYQPDKNYKKAYPALIPVEKEKIFVKR